MLQLILFVCIFVFHNSNASVLLWSKHKLQISPLASFTDSTFADLVQELGYPEVALYKNTNEEIPSDFKDILSGYYSAYNPNGEINIENATEITGQEDVDLLKLKQRLESPENEHVLSVLVVPRRGKRETADATSPPAPTSTTELPLYAAPSGPVLYRAESVADGTFGLLYSAQPLLLSANGSRVHLGAPPRPDMMTVDTKAREASARLNVNIPVEDDNKVTLRFKFALAAGYWSLVSVKVSDTSRLYAFELALRGEVRAPLGFSHHCGGVTVFAGQGAELALYDLQAQIYAGSGRFGDAYDCVDFTTAPIWSGLLVVALLGVGLLVALTAILDIKTMDKFDNAKTKQLVITVAE